MSHTPVRQKSRKAVTAAIANAASRKPAPAPHLVVLRVKRKREDAAVDNLVVATDEGETGEEQGLPDRKRCAAMTESIAGNMAVLSLSMAAEQHGQHHRVRDENAMQPPRRLVYKRVRTTEPNGSSDGRKGERSPTVSAPPVAPKHLPDGGGKSGRGGRLDALLVSRGLHSPVSSSPPPSAVLDYMEVRRVKARTVCIVNPNVSAASYGRGGCEKRHSASPPGDTAEPANLHVIDLQAVGRTDTHTMMDSSGMDDGGGGGATKDAPTAAAPAKRVAAPVLTPGERQMDEAIFTAFQTGDMSRLRDILATSSSPSPASVNYRRRLGDASTALMAAAFHGDLGTIRHLLSLGAKASLVDAGGNSAALLAGMRGHRECFAELQRFADEEEKEERARSSVRRGLGRGGGVDDGGGGDFVYDLYYFESSTSAPPQAIDGAGGAPPVVRLSGIGPVEENAVGTMADVELEFEHDSAWSDLGDDDDGEDPDSNSEGYYGNDYPEDEEDHLYAGGSGSSCTSENGSSSSDGGAGFDSDSDNEPYCRRVVNMRKEYSGGFGALGGVGDEFADVEDNGSGDDFSGFSVDGRVTGSAVGVDGLVKTMPPISGGGDCGCGATGTDVNRTVREGLGGAEVFAWNRKR